MERLSANDLVRFLDDEEVAALDQYIDKCAEAGKDPGISSFFEKLEKTAENMESAYQIGCQLAEYAVEIADTRARFSDIPDVMVEKAASRFEDAGLALFLADMAAGAFFALDSEE